MSVIDDHTESQTDASSAAVAEPDAVDDLFEKVRNTTVGKSIFRSPRRVTPRDRAAGH